MNVAGMNGTKPKAIVLDKPRARRDAAKVLAIALQTRLRRLYDAQASNVENEIVVATADMAQVMYENIEFVIWALKSQGGMNPPPPEELRPVSKSHVAPPANDPRFQKPPVPVLEETLNETLAKAGLDTCTCPPLEAGIIGRDRHMTSCPKFVP